MHIPNCALGVGNISVCGRRIYSTSGICASSPWDIIYIYTVYIYTVYYILISCFARNELLHPGGLFLLVS